MAYQADVPGSVARGPRFGPTHQHSTMPDESVLYGIRSKGCAPLKKVGFHAHRCQGCRDEGCHKRQNINGKRAGKSL
jgi:hypothetical protein